MSQYKRVPSPSGAHRPLSASSSLYISAPKINEYVTGSYTAVIDFWSGFRQWIHKSPAIDLGFGIIIGGLFTNILTSFMDDILSPPISLLFGTSMQNYFIVLKNGVKGPPYVTLQDANADGAVTENIGKFLQSCLFFFLTSFFIYMIIRMFQAFKVRLDREAAEFNAFERSGLRTLHCPECDSEISARARKCPFCTSVIVISSDSDKDGKKAAVNIGSHNCLK